jgi:integrase
VRQWRSEIIATGAVDLIEPLAADLAAYRPARPAPGALAVESASGGYVDLANWRRRVWKEAFPGSPYDGRHTYASLLIHEGRSLPYVTAALGHSTAKTTLDHYAHTYAEAQLGTATRMVDAILEAAGCAEGFNPHPSPASSSGPVML